MDAHTDDNPDAKLDANDEPFMRLALAEAEQAAADGEVPIGAVVVYEGRVIGSGRNRREHWADPTAHAEIVALRRAGALLGGWRLTNCALYATIEPCAMCAGAAVVARWPESCTVRRTPSSVGWARSSTSAHTSGSTTGFWCARACWRMSARR